MAAGIALVAGSMLVGLLLFQAAESTTSVLVAANDLSPGQELVAEDFRVREVVVDPTVAVITLAEQAVFFGDGVPRTVRGFVPAGTIVAEEHFVARSEALAPGEIVVGVRLPPGSYPTRLAAGDTVELYGVGDRGQTEAVLLGKAEVRYASISTQTGNLLADLLMDDSIQLSAIQAHSVDRLRLALVRGQ